MLASEHCNDSFYDSQYHSVKMTTDYNFKQEPDLFLDNGSTTATSANATTTATSSSTSSPSSNMIAYQTNQHYQLHVQQTLWNKQHCPTTTTTSTVDNSYPTDDLFYASLPPPPPAPPMSTLPSLPRKKYLAKRHHPRHHSANGILQQYTHYHQQQHLQSPHQQQYYLGYPHQRHLSSSTVISTSPPTSDFTIPSSCASTVQYPTTTSTLSSPTNASFSPMSPTSILKQSQCDDAQDKLSSIPSSAPPLRYEILLQASTAAAQRFGESSSMTYLNRGQAYGLQFVDQKQHQSSNDVLITSTISIAFHDATHRQASQNYWRFWLSQQDRPNEARALDLDAQQSSGLVNVHYPSFDRITFQWQAQTGATLFVRFNCLSTDFSRIKGVKGIPLRALVESTESSSSSPSSPLIGTDDIANCTEKSFCKIKLFRDKGAERKNKDDAKQIAKQLEKLKAEGNPQHNPLWHFYNRPVFPYSTFDALPEEDDVIKDDFPMALATTTAPPLSIPTVASNIGAPSVFKSLPPPPPSSTSTTSSSMSSLSPTSLIGTNSMVSPIQSFSQNNFNHHPLQHQYQQQQQPDNAMTIVPPFYSPPFSYPVNYAQVSSPSFMFDSMTSPPLTSSSLAYPQQQQQSWASSNISPVVGMKRSRSHMVASYSDHPSPPEDQPPMKKLQGCLPVLTLFVDTKKSQASMELKRIELDTLTVQELIMKLSALFSLQAQSVTEVLWRRDSSTAISNSPLDMQSKKSTNQSSPSNVLVLVEDCVLEQFPDQGIMTVQWEISSTGMARFILEL